MEHFTLYSSGIAMARFAVGDGTLLHEKREERGLVFSVPAPMTADDDAAYAAFKVKPFFLLSQCAGFEAAAKEAPEAFSLGEMRYTRAEPDMWPCAAFGSSPGMGPGTKANAEPNATLGAKPGADPDAEPCTALGTKPDTGSCAAPGTKPNAETVINPNGKPGTGNAPLYYIQRNTKFPCNALFLAGRLIAWLCPSREQANLLVRDGFEEYTPFALWSDYAGRPLYGVQGPETCRVPMRDGVELATDVYLPEGAALPVPALLVRTPYDRDNGAQNYFRYVRRGYAVVVQDVRGRNESGGEWMPHYYEVEDGDDTLTWVGTQRWCDGNVGTLGGSYLGYTQWCAAALGNPYLKAMVSVVTAGTAMTDSPMHGGCLGSGGFAWMFSMTKQRCAPERMARDDWDEVLDIRPLQDIPLKALGEEVPFIRKTLEHPCEDDFWLRGNWAKRNVGRVIPVLIQSGWFDDNGMGTTEALDLTAGYPAGTRKVILGPWQHGGNSMYDLHALSFPANALRFDLDLIYQKWFDHFLRGEENGIEQTAPVEYYTMGENKWKTARCWPVEQADDTPFYFGENGMLFPISGRSGHDSYWYDPKHPGTHIIDMCENEIAVPEDYTEEEQRADYLCYTTPPLAAPLTVTGDAAVTLYISSDAPDTDFIGRLCDVDENGRSVKLADGVLAARFRNGFETPEFLTPGAVERLVIRTSKVSHCFLPGHRLRVSVTSGAKNLVFPNSNTEAGYNSTETRVALNSVWYGGGTPSHILLHVEQG